MTTFRFLLILAIAFLSACASNKPSGPAQSPEEAVAAASGAAGSDKTNKELSVQTAASQEGDATNSSADVRNQEDTQATTSGHVQTLGFAGIGGSLGTMIKDDPVLRTITAEIDKILTNDALTPEQEARLDKLRADMVARSAAVMEGMAAVAPSFDGLKTIVAIFSMENATGHEKKPLTDVAAGHKADAFKAAIEALKGAVNVADESDGN